MKRMGWLVFLLAGVLGSLFIGARVASAWTCGVDSPPDACEGLNMCFFCVELPGGGMSMGCKPCTGSSNDYSWSCPAGTTLTYSNPPVYQTRSCYPNCWTICDGACETFCGPDICPTSYCLYRSGCQPPVGAIVGDDYPDPAPGAVNGCRVAGNGTCTDGKAFCQACWCVPNVSCTPTQPKNPALYAPANGSSASLGVPVRLSWGGMTGADWGTGCPTNRQWRIYLSTNPNPTTLIASYAAGTVFTHDFTPTAYTTYYWKVRTDNGSLYGESPVWSFTVPAAPTPPPVSNITGTVYYDPGNTCVSGSSTPSNFGGAVRVNWSGGSASVASNGTYSINTTSAGFYNLTLSGIPGTYQCSSCSSACPTKTSVVSPSSGNNFYLRDLLLGQSWWQAVGAGVYAGSGAGGVTIKSDLPSSSTRLVIPGTNDLAAVVRASGSVETGSGSISTTNWSARSTYQGKKMDYRFFASQMGLTPGASNDFLGGAIAESEITPGEDFYYAVDSVDGEVSLEQAWTVTSGESYVIFVDGNLLINHNVTVAPGGFLAFIVSGGVRVSSAADQVQGIYVIDEQLVTEVDNQQLGVEGMMIAWGGVNLNRDLGGVTNYTTPAEKFTYRPDLLVNMPEKMKNFALRWQEVVPGTFD